MIKIADVVNTLSGYLTAQRELQASRQRASGDAEYFSYSYAQDFKQAEASLEQTLNAYIDQRLAQKAGEA